MEFIKNIWKNRYSYAQYTASAASILNGIGLVGIFSESDTMLLLCGVAIFPGILLTLCTYCLGGFWTAVKASLGIAKWGWLIVPFPYDLATGFMAFFFALFALILFPIIPVHKARKDRQMQQYMEQCMEQRMR